MGTGTSEIGKGMMSSGWLVWRSLTFHWRTNLAVLFACAVGSSVLTGALLVGDSMRASLWAMAQERLGDIDLALVSTRFFTQDLPERIARSERFPSQFEHSAGLILIRGSVIGPSGRIVPRVNLIGTTPEFWRLFPALDPAEPMAPEPEQVLVNAELAAALEIKEGDRLIARFEKASAIPREALLGGRDTERAIRSLAGIEVDQVIANRGAGRFSLEHSGRLPRNLYVPIGMLAKALERPGLANAILLAETELPTQGSSAENPPALPDDQQRANELLKESATLEDYGLWLRRSEALGYVSVEGRRLVIEDSLVESVERAAAALGVVSQPALTYLADTIRAGDREIPYAIVTAFDPRGRLSFPTEPPGVELAEKEILLNQWARQQLSAEAGGPVRVDYRIVTPTGALAPRSHEFRLAGMVRLEGTGRDPDFTPNFPGISDAKNVLDWDPPFPLDLGRIRPADESYWDDYRTVPKAFIRLEEGQSLWGTRFGRVTSVRLAPPAGQSVVRFEEAFRRELLAQLRPREAGLEFRSVRAEAVAASTGSTDFGALFLAFSIFLIGSALLLVGLSFRLNAERRASQVGLLLAIGLGVGSVQRLLLAEGLCLAGLGGLVGLAGAMVYADAMIAMLTARWQAAVSVPLAIEFHWTARSLLVGVTVSVLLAMVAIWWASRQLARAPVPGLLHRGFTFAALERASPPRWSWGIAGLGLVGGPVSLAAAPWIGQVAGFFAAGVFLLVGALACSWAIWVRQPSGTLRGGGWSGLARLGIRNGARHPARSVLTAGAIALATFLVVAVGVLRHGEHHLAPDKSSGNGGFRLFVEATSPLFVDLDDSDARRYELGLSDRTDQLLRDAQVHSLRVREGDEASCLNVLQPGNPTVFGVSRRFIERGGFAFAGTLADTPAERANPWQLLEADPGDGPVPAIGDWNSLLWILKVDPLYIDPVGKRVTLPGPGGRPIELRIVGALAGSIFQGQLLVSERNFLRLFPDEEGYRAFVIEAPAAGSGELADRLQQELARDYGFEVTTTSQRLATYRAVENTYMGAFQTLGGLGLVLGTLGLAAVLLRNALERRGELGVMRAIGFHKAALAWLVLAETVFLLSIGVLAGTGCALVAILPQLLHLPDYSALLPLAGLLGIELFVGTASGLAAVLAALRTPVLEALRAE